MGTKQRKQEIEESHSVNNITFLKTSEVTILPECLLCVFFGEYQKSDMPKCMVGRQAVWI